MLIGRVAAWTGRPAWTLLQPAQVVVTSFAVVAAFLLWRRLVDDGPALLASASVFVSMVEPSKGNEILVARGLPALAARDLRRHPASQRTGTAAGRCTRSPAAS